MPESVKTSPKKEEEKPKGVLEKIKDKILPDEDEQAAIISTFVRLGVLVWSGGILTLNYVAIPGVPQQKHQSHCLPPSGSENGLDGRCKVRPPGRSG